MTTGEKIAAMRRGLGLSQEALADKLGLSRQAVSKWEADQAVPGMDNLVELGKLFGVPVDALLRPDEALPGKSGGEPAEEPAAPPDGFSASCKPVPAQKAKWFIIAAALLLCASVLCNFLTLGWLTELQGRVTALRQQVENLPNGVDTVYMPSYNDPAPAASDMADARVEHTLDKDDPAKLSLQISAMPREIDAAETARFCVKGGGQRVTVDASYENGNYMGVTTFPLLDSVSVYLLLTKGGTTRNLLVENLYDLEDEYALAVELSLEGGESWSVGRGTSITGRLCVAVGSHAASTVLYPVSGRAILYVNGVEYDSVPIDEIVERADEWRRPDMSDVSLLYYLDLPWEHIDAPLEAITWAVELTDNFGRVFTAE